MGLLENSGARVDRETKTKKFLTLSQNHATISLTNSRGACCPQSLKESEC